MMITKLVEIEERIIYTHIEVLRYRKGGTLVADLVRRDDLGIEVDRRKNRVFGSGENGADEIALLQLMRAELAHLGKEPFAEDWLKVDLEEACVLRQIILKPDDAKSDLVFLLSQTDPQLALLKRAVVLTSWSYQNLKFLVAKLEIDLIVHEPTGVGDETVAVQETDIDKIVIKINDKIAELDLTETLHIRLEFNR